MQKNTNDKISVRIKQFTLTNENFKELMALKEKGKFDLLSNIQIVMLDVYNNVFPKMERIIHFQGVNGVGFFDAKTSRKMKSFYQKDLEYKEDPDFEKKYVDKKDTVDKIDYQFTLGEKMNLETSNLSSSQSQSSSSGQQSPRKKRNLKY